MSQASKTDFEWIETNLLPIDPVRFEKYAVKTLGKNWREQAQKAARFFGGA